ncbi:uncharacterized protein LOC128993256 [Macrosteles quadrilineatus]|uniref:uncharacterized protein LOC128993256 n=1 Tax=Macrosteles quadrilineatus TaxID=74068 RepID=UPI0023E18931|nr:uncharacterized protein LOC128993256 [Macrosteles quadrilineatus]
MFLARAILLVFIYNEAVRPVAAYGEVDVTRHGKLVDTYAPLESDLNSAIFYEMIQGSRRRIKQYEPLEEVPTRETYVCNAEVFSSSTAKLQIVKIKKADKSFVRLQIKFNGLATAVPLATYCTFQAYQGPQPDDAITQDTVLFIREDSNEKKVLVTLKTYSTGKWVLSSKDIDSKFYALDITYDEDGRPVIKSSDNRQSSEKKFKPVDKMCAEKVG